MRTKSRPCKKGSTSGLSSDTNLATEVSDNTVNVGTSSFVESVHVDSCYEEGLSVETGIGVGSLKRKRSFVQSLGVVVGGEVCHVGSCHSSRSKKLDVDENFGEVTVGGLHVSEPTGMSVGQKRGYDTGLIVGSSVGDIFHEGSYSSQRATDVLNVLKRKPSCVEQPLLENDMKRRRDNLEVSTGVCDTVLDYVGPSVNVLKRKAIDLEKSPSDSNSVRSVNPLHLDTGHCLSDLRVDSEPTTLSKKRIVVAQQGLVQDHNNGLSPAGEPVSNLQSISSMQDVSESVSRDVAHAVTFPKPVVLNFQSGTVRHVAVTHGYGELTTPDANSCSSFSYEMDFGEPDSENVVVGFPSQARIREPVALEFRSRRPYNASQGDTFHRQESSFDEYTMPASTTDPF